MRIAHLKNQADLASEYQGLTVNRIAEDAGRCVTPSEQVVLAPAPATLDEEEDLAMAALACRLPARRYIRFGEQPSGRSPSAALAPSIDGEAV